MHTGNYQLPIPRLIRLDPIPSNQASASENKRREEPRQYPPLFTGEGLNNIPNSGNYLVQGITHQRQPYAIIVTGGSQNLEDQAKHLESVILEIITFNLVVLAEGKNIQEAEAFIRSRLHYKMSQRNFHDCSFSLIISYMLKTVAAGVQGPKQQRKLVFINYGNTVNVCASGSGIFNISISNYDEKFRKKKNFFFRNVDLHANSIVRVTAGPFFFIEPFLKDKKATAADFNNAWKIYKEDANILQQSLKDFGGAIKLMEDLAQEIVKAKCTVDAIQKLEIKDEEELKRKKEELNQSKKFISSCAKGVLCLNAAEDAFKKSVGELPLQVQLLTLIKFSIAGDGKRDKFLQDSFNEPLLLTRGAAGANTDFLFIERCYQSLKKHYPSACPRKPYELSSVYAAARNEISQLTEISAPFVLSMRQTTDVERAVLARGFESQNHSRQSTVKTISTLKNIAEKIATKEPPSLMELTDYADELSKMIKGGCTIAEFCLAKSLLGRVLFLQVKADYSKERFKRVEENLHEIIYYAASYQYSLRVAGNFQYILENIQALNQLLIAGVNEKIASSQSDGRTMVDAFLRVSGYQAEREASSTGCILS